MGANVLTTPAGARVLAATQAAFRVRADPRHLRLRHEMGSRYAHPRFELVPLATLLSAPISYGTSVPLSEDPVGRPVLRMNNLTMDGWDTAEIKYQESEPQDSDRVRREDVLVNRTNGSIGLVGKAAVFDLEGDDWLYASYLLRLRLDTRRVVPQYLVDFLNSPAGRVQVEMHARPILMVNVNPAEVGSILVPLPPTTEEQARLLEPLMEARLERITREREAYKILTAMNSDVAARLGVPFAGGPTEQSYATTTKLVRISDRLSPQFFHPERAAAIVAIRDAAVPHRTLACAADFIRDSATPSPGDAFVGLSAVVSQTGELVPLGETAASALRYQTGDVLFARLRPYLNKVHLASQPGLCSTEFYVLRAKPGVVPAYLAVLLRSALVTAQTVHMMTGNTHPRVAPEDAKLISIPIPDTTTQKAIAAEYEQRLAEADRLRAAANNDWLEAQRAFNEALLGPVTTAK